MSYFSQISPKWFGLDAFERLRVSETGQRFDIEFIYDKQPLVMDEIAGAGGGTATFNSTSRDVTLSTGGTAANRSMTFRQHYWNPYTPGNGQEIIITGTLNPTPVADWTNAYAEFGYGDDSNGVGFRYDENGARIFHRDAISGLTTFYNQADWDNVVSTADWSKSQIFVIDFQSLKIGRIRFGLDRGGVVVPVLTIENDNIRASGYWQYASLPVYWKVSNSGVAVSTVSSRAVCATVKSMGGRDLLDIPGLPFAASNGATKISVGAGLIPILSIQVQTQFPAASGIVNRQIVVPTGLSFTNDNSIYWELRRNATLTGASFASVDGNSCVFKDVSATVVTGGTVIASGYAGVGGARAGSTTTGFTGRIPLSLNAAGTTGDILTVAAQRTTASSSACGAALEWKEIR